MDSASIDDYELIEQFARTAADRNIPHQRSVLPRGGTDLGAMQGAGEGVRTMSLSCPMAGMLTASRSTGRSG